MLKGKIPRGALPHVSALISPYCGRKQALTASFPPAGYEGSAQQPEDARGRHEAFQRLVDAARGNQCGSGRPCPGAHLVLQSGHGSNCAARNYMVPRNPHILFETYNAFGL